MASTRQLNGIAPEIVDDVFTYTSKRGKKISIDLDIPPDFFKKAMEGDKSEDEQFEAAAGSWLDETTRVAFDEMGALERTRFIRAFFEAFQEAAEMPLGESLSSSGSSRSTAPLSSGTSADTSA